MPYDQLRDDVNSAKAQSCFLDKDDSAIIKTTFGQWKKMQSSAPLSISTWIAFMQRSRCATVLHYAVNRSGWAVRAIAAAF